MRVLSGVQPSGELHLGNYVGALRQWVAQQHEYEALYCIVDLHALTLAIDPVVLNAKTFDTAVGLLAAGLDPTVCHIFCQSHVPEHPRLTWFLECTASMGELRRMTQFKEKAGAQEGARVGLFTYPVLMAADILLYDADRVPVGDDQRQHLELARELANRFNHRYGPTFVVPEASIPTVGARVMDLQHPTRKMSKSVDSPLGTIFVLDPPAEIDRKIKKAVTDTDGEMRYDRQAKPGLANLLDLMSVATDRPPSQVADGYQRYGDLKRDLSAALVEMLAPVQARCREFAADPAGVHQVLRQGARRAEAIAGPTYRRAAAAMGLLEP